MFPQARPSGASLARAGIVPSAARSGTLATMVIDTSFDFRTDAGGKDPDVYSPTLRQCHKRLWSKRLPTGCFFSLDDTVRGVYLHHRSELGEFFLSSDSVIPTFTRWGFAKAHPELYTEQENTTFMDISYTIGGMMVFPGNRIQGKWTINQARGCLRKISDRFDLTVECIRRHYARQSSPLGETLARYVDSSRCLKTSSGTWSSSCFRISSLRTALT
jgi:hypothetical protein